MLFLPPRPPWQLRDRQRLVLGRSRTCELTLSGPDASRRHAEIGPGRTGFVVRDLNSTNGTWVNGERIEERALQPGDRIQIGENTITFCHVDVEWGDPVDQEDAETLVTERPQGPTANEAFQGSLCEIPAFAVLQVLELGRKTGRLHLDSDAVQGDLWLDSGRPVHAEVKGLAGFDAALEIVNTTSGHFMFEPRAVAPEPTISASMTELLLEGTRSLDEGIG
jgi:predicted component of type VI protein secretion system